MTLDELKVKAEAAKAWRPTPACFLDGYSGDDAVEGAYVPCRPPESPCHACLGAQRAVEDIELCIENALLAVKQRRFERDDHLHHAEGYVDRADRIASYFASEPNPVSIFRDAVLEMTR